jgi:hypothetical protein
VLGAEPDVSIRREVKHHVGPVHRLGECLLIEGVAPDERKGWEATRPDQEAFLTRGEVIKADDIVPEREQAVDEVAADEPGGAGDCALH